MVDFVSFASFVFFSTPQKWWEAIDPGWIWRFGGDEMAKTCAEKEEEEDEMQKLRIFAGQKGSVHIRWR